MRGRFFMASYDRRTTDSERAQYEALGVSPVPEHHTEVIYNTTRDDVAARARELMRLYDIDEARVEAVTGEYSESGTIIASSIETDADDPYDEVISGLPE